jgi:serine/threonine protein kinase
MTVVEDSHWKHLPQRFRVRKVLFRAGPAGALIADDLKDGHSALLRVIPLSWLHSETLEMFDAAYERLVRTDLGSGPRTPPIEVVLSGQVAFLTRRFLPGTTLSDWDPHRRPDVRAFVRICLSAVASLADLHALDIVHGNIKASNICVSADQATVVDYGLFGWNRTSSQVRSAGALTHDVVCLGAVLLTAFSTMEAEWETGRHGVEFLHEPAGRLPDAYLALKAWLAGGPVPAHGGRHHA